MHPNRCGPTPVRGRGRRVPGIRCVLSAVSCVFLSAATASAESVPIEDAIGRNFTVIGTGAPAPNEDFAAVEAGYKYSLGLVGPLLPRGACCALIGACTFTPETACVTPSTWQGPGITCLPNPCPQPTGACCAPDGSCTVTAQTACTDPNAWQGADIPCTPELCTVSGVDDAPLAATLAFRVAPTPFAERTALVFAGPKGTEASLQIFDVAGRRVRSAWRGILDGRTITQEWDGRDDAGRETPTGVYLARLRSGANEVVVRLIRAR